MSASHEDERSLERLLRAGRADPGDAQLRQLEDRFDTWLAESGAPPSGAYATTTALRRVARILPFVGVAFVVVGVGVFGLASSSDGRAPAMHDEARRSSVAPDRVSMVTEPSRSVRMPAPEPAVVSALRVPVVDVPSRVPSSPPQATEPAPEPAPPASEPAAETVASGVADTSETEVSYLRRSRGALKADPSRALAIANGHPARFPHGALDQERELIAIDALVRLGRKEEARARADAFRARYPSSAHLARVTALVGGSP